MDKFAKEKRSDIMSKIRSKNTKPELLVFRELRKRKIYFYKHYAKILGKPDIALPRKKIAVFIDGDFWHGYKFSNQKNRLPKEYWLDKIESNVKRDRRIRLKLKKEGWNILRVWSHEIINKRPGIDKIIDFLNPNSAKSPSKSSIATVTK